MLDPRIYRTGLVAVALAVIVFAFSLESQPGGSGTTLAPDAFNPANAQSTLTWLSRTYPDRRPGSARRRAHGRLRGRRAGQARLRGHASRPSRPTPDGQRTLVNVTGTLAGQSNDTIVIVSHRDARGAPACSRPVGDGGDARAGTRPGR